jgi:rubrerythrin
MSSIKLLNLIDEYKKKMPDGLYKKLADSLMEINNSDEEKDKKEPYEVRILVPEYKPLDTSPTKVMIFLSTEKRIKMYTKSEYEHIKEKIDRTGIYDEYVKEIDYHFLFQETGYTCNECDYSDEEDGSMCSCSIKSKNIKQQSEGIISIPRETCVSIKKL